MTVKGTSQVDHSAQTATIPEKGKWVYQGEMKKRRGKKGTDVFPNGIDLVENSKMWLGTKEINNNNKGNY